MSSSSHWVLLDLDLFPDLKAHRWNLLLNPLLSAKCASELNHQKFSSYILFYLNLSFCISVHLRKSKLWLSNSNFKKRNSNNNNKTKSDRPLLRVFNTPYLIYQQILSFLPSSLDYRNSSYHFYHYYKPIKLAFVSDHPSSFYSLNQLICFQVSVVLVQPWEIQSRAWGNGESEFRSIVQSTSKCSWKMKIREV